MLDPRTADVLRQAVAAAQAGDLQRAQRLAEGALVQGGDVAALNAFLGMLRARSGDAAGAIRHLKAAHRGRPGDVTIACNLIAALIESGETTDALAVATRELALSDSTLRVARYRGFLAQSLERFADAVEAYEHVVKHNPADFESWNNLGNARSGVGDFAGSVLALQHAFELDPQAPPTRLNLANALRAADRTAEAVSILRAAAADFPDDARALYELYVQFKRESRQEEALPVLEEAVARDPNNASLQLKLGVECGLVNRIEDAERAFRKAIALDLHMADAYLGLVIQYEHTNREDEFAPLIALAEENGLDQGALSFLRAMEHRRAGRFELGLECLALVPSTIEPERSAHIRATLLDRLGRSDEAFAAFEETARLHEAHPTEPVRRGNEFRDELRSEIEMLTPEWVAGWSDANPAPKCADPVFLVGFPRSGTTLLDTILMGHPGAVVLEEKPPLNLVDIAIGGLAGIPALDEAGIVNARAQYFDEVGKIEELGASSLLIDKSPLFLHKAALIQRLFPNARFILALRHPCDVLLSCFMSNFRLNAAMSNFLRLEDAAEFYDLTFQHWERSRALLPLNVHTIVYERLVDDVETEVRPLFDFLGLEWHEGALDHQRTAKSRGLITTASYSQVTEPIYKRAAGRWQRYRKHLEPIFPTLEPWVEKFGYSL
ncbi:tetratricopeptide repeat-containing sulfotransferase family protein [Sphingomonas cavernae]|uniref:Sulfotransferase family protein n=1 Tax=Sphingomonas cavernae TaxID=2320861 RepID=A0A418WQ20_9SPHN|nr:tetratricopeptide repeat-containing sulfotransferase family protein [Sphingomonas cavernae]RJF93357.1 sulfotransferase family protein [Sphingomonas cavernae]